MSDRTAQLATLYREHGPALLRYLRRRFLHAGCDTRLTADDLLQETFVQALRRPEAIESAVSPRAWLFGIARHVGLTTIRSAPIAAVALDTDPAAVAAPDEDPRLDAMRRAITALPPALRETIELRLADALSYDEIARVLDVPIGTVRSRLHHAVRQLRAALVAPPPPPAPGVAVMSAGASDPRREDDRVT